MDNPRIAETVTPQIPAQQQSQDAPRAGSRVVGTDDAAIPRSSRADRQVGSAASNNAQSSSPTLLQRSVRALSNSAPVSTIAHSLKKSLPVSQFNQSTRYPLPDFTGQSSQLRDALQGNIVELKRSTSPPERDQLQQLAHRNLQAYANHARSLGDRVIPTLSEAFQGSMYNLVFFGLFRGAGENAASVLHQHMNNQPLQLGYYADANAPGQSGEQALIEHSLRLFISSFTGALGDMTAAHGIAPLFNAIGRQTKPIPSEVLVPDRMRDLMNQLEPGSGDALRSKVEAQELELSSGASRSNIQIAQNIFTGFWTLKNALHPGPFGAAGNMAQLGLGTTIPGAIIGATVAMNKLFGTADIPELQALEAAVANDTPLSEVPNHEVPLYYTEHAEGTSYMQRLMNTYGNDPLRDPVPEQSPEGQSVAGEHRTASTASNVITTVAQRSLAIGQATFPGTALFAAMGPVSDSVTNEQVRTLINVVFNGLALFSIVQNWSVGVSLDVPEQQDALHESRQNAVNAAYIEPVPEPEEEISEFEVTRIEL